MPESTHLQHLLYLHGFRSSPQSAKARQTLAYFAEHYPHITVSCPQLPVSPQEATQLIQQIVRDWPHATMAVIGSSLGGYYANWLSHQVGCPAVLLNPAAYPARDLEKYMGETHSWHNPDEKLFFQPHFIGELQALQIDPDISSLTAPQLAVIAKGDEVLNWQEMWQHYRQAHQHIVEGGDHALTGVYTELLPDIGRFLVSLGKELPAPFRAA